MTQNTLLTVVAWVAVIILGVLALYLALLEVSAIVEEDNPGPQQVFEAHLLALDESRVDDALSYVDTASCGTLALDGAAEVLAELEGLGYTFSTTFRVEEVWILEDGSEALLTVTSPTNIPLQGIYRMHKVGGDWRVTCE